MNRKIKRSQRVPKVVVTKIERKVNFIPRQEPTLLTTNYPEPKQRYSSQSKTKIPGNEVFTELLGQEILLVSTSEQLNILGQTFRPIFCGTLVEVEGGHITLNPVIIKMTNAPFFKFPTPLSFAIEHISSFTPFNCETRFPIS
ncbi:MAG: hypothetical protein M0T74_17975 [Desulfitobacterium hafniense]|nr:hypothetical protein [Desulfitobacterium hafniense]